MCGGGGGGGGGGGDGGWGGVLCLTGTAFVPIPIEQQNIKPAD